MSIPARSPTPLLIGVAVRRVERMDKKFVATSSAVIDASADRVWAVMTDPVATKEFMFGTELTLTGALAGTFAGVARGTARSTRTKEKSSNLSPRASW